MEYNFELFLSNEISSFLKKSIGGACVNVKVDGKNICALDPSEPSTTLSLSGADHVISLSCQITEIGMKFEYNTEARVALRDDVSVEIDVNRREYKVLPRLIGDETRGSLEVTKATVKRERLEHETFKALNIDPTEISKSFHVPIVLHFILCFCTCGIWNIIWTYRATQFTNSLYHEEWRDPLPRTALCTLVPFYVVCWNNETARRIDSIAMKVGVESNMLGVWQVCTFYLAFAMPVIMQGKINQIIKASNEKAVR